MLSSNQKILNEAEWLDLQAKWINSGQSVVCSPSRVIGDFKAEIEKLCSIEPCSFETKAAINQALKKIDLISKKARDESRLN